MRPWAKPTGRTLLGWGAVALVLWQVFRWYQAPDLVRDLADLFWSCL